MAYRHQAQLSESGQISSTQVVPLRPRSPTPRFPVKTNLAAPRPIHPRSLAGLIVRMYSGLGLADVRDSVALERRHDGLVDVVT